MKRRRTVAPVAPDAAVSALPRGRIALARAVLDALPDHIYVKDLQGRYVLINQAGLQQRNVARLDDVVGKTAHDMMPRGVADRMTVEDRSVMETGEVLVNREEVTRFPGVAGDMERRWHITTKLPMRDALGRVVGVLGINRDITDRKRAELALRESEETFRAVFDQAAVGITVVSPDLRFLRVNDKYCAMLGYTRSELQAMVLTDLVPPEDREGTVHYRRQLLAGGAPGQDVRERELVRKDGTRIWVSLATSLVRDADAEPRYFVSVVQDISEARRTATALQESEERFRHLAYFDSLTELPNRALFQDRLRMTLAQAARSKSAFALMVIDVDRFKQVNDTLGHAVGDELLAQIAARLRAAVRSGDTVARLGGDEFAVILATIAKPGDAGTVAQKILDRFGDPVRLEAGEIPVGLSVGIALYPRDGTDARILLKHADTAMYRAKAAGRGCFRFCGDPR